MTLGMHCLGSLANNMLCGIDYRGDGEFTAEGINTLCDALKSTTTLTSLKYASQLESLPTNVLTAFDARPPSSYSIRNNRLGDSADTLVAAARELPQLVTLCGIKPEQETVDFSGRYLDVGDAKLLAFDLSRNQTIKTLK